MDKIVSEHLNALKVGSHLVKASLQIADLGDYLGLILDGHALFKVALCDRSHRLAYPRYSTDPDLDHRKGDTRTDGDTGKTDRGDQQNSVIYQIIEKGELTEN